jgi:hypothetical protein
MMPSPESDELSKYLDQLIEATRDGSMKWVEANPTTLVWDTRSPTPARLALQRFDQQLPVNLEGRTALKKVTRHVLQVLDTSSHTPTQRMMLSGTEDEELNDKLKSLFEAAKSAMVRQSFDFLKSIIPTKT